MGGPESNRRALTFEIVSEESVLGELLVLGILGPGPGPGPVEDRRA